MIYFTEKEELDEASFLSKNKSNSNKEEENSTGSQTPNRKPKASDDFTLSLGQKQDTNIGASYLIESGEDPFGNIYTDKVEHRKSHVSISELDETNEFI